MVQGKERLSMLEERVRNVESSSHQQEVELKILGTKMGLIAALGSLVGASVATAAIKLFFG
jgi:hypothetical protein